jgi:2-haloacid dehalogenase
MKELFADIRAISLDAMGTIIDLKIPPQETYYEILKHLGHAWQKTLPLIREPDLFRRYWKEAEKRLPPAFLSEHVDRFAHYGEMPYAFWGLIFRVMFENLKLPVEEADAAVQVAYHRFAEPDLWTVESGLAELVAFCSVREINLFVTSNWDFRLPRILKGLGIASFFREIITSALVGFEKPSEKIFHYLVSLAECPPSQVLHIGDRIKDDILGAKEAGLRAVLYRREKFSGDDFLFARVQSLRELPGLLSSGE